MSTSVKGQTLPIPSLHGHYSASSILRIGLTSNRPQGLLTLEGLEIFHQRCWVLSGSSHLPCEHAMLLDPAEAVLLEASSVLSSPVHTGSTLWLHKYFSELYRLRVIVPTQWPVALPVYASRFSFPESCKTRYRASFDGLTLVRL